MSDATDYLRRERQAAEDAERHLDETMRTGRTATVQDAEMLAHEAEHAAEDTLSKIKTAGAFLVGAVDDPQDDDQQQIAKATALVEGASLEEYAAEMVLLLDPEQRRALAALREHPDTTIRYVTPSDPRRTLEVTICLGVGRTGQWEVRAQEASRAGERHTATLLRDALARIVYWATPSQIAGIERDIIHEAIALDAAGEGS